MMNLSYTSRINASSIHQYVVYLVCIGLSLSLCLSLNMTNASAEALDLKNSPTLTDSSQLLDKLKLKKVKKSGKRLMNLALGLHKLGQAQAIKEQTAQKRASPQKQISLLVHGYKSQGYEWIYAILQLAKSSEVYVLRWDWTLCPQQGAQVLTQGLNTLQKLNPQADIHIYGHSYGGVISSITAANYQKNQPLTVNVIAAPVAGYPKLEQRCAQSVSKLTQKLTKHNQTHNKALKVYQWRTQKDLDGAFKDMDNDPQQVDWHGTVTLLPREYKGHRLGHNWSISWVIDQIVLK